MQGFARAWLMFALLMLAACLSAWSPPALADAPRVSTVPHTGAYSAKITQTQGNVSVIELTGDYNRTTPEGVFNVEPRTEVAKEFLKSYADNYDFLVVFSNFEYNTGAATAFCLPLRNETSGLGIEKFDNSAEFGSRGRLQGYIDMAALNRYVMQPSDAQFEKVMLVLAHEMLHRWGIHTTFMDASGQRSRALIGESDSHWSFLMDTGGSVEYGNRWQDNGDGTFTSLPGRQFYSPLDLYLMGFLKKEEVPPFFYIDSPDMAATELSRAGVTVRGVRRDVTIDQIVAAEGERQPDAASSQKQFRLGFVILTRPGIKVSDAQIQGVEAVRRAYEARLPILSGGRAITQTFLEPKALAAQSGSSATGPVIHAGSTASAASALNWLQARQGTDGAWRDNSLTAVRDTAVVVEALRDVQSSSSPAVGRALDWLSAQPASNADYGARRQSLLAAQATDEDWLRWVSTQNSDGGWGIAPGYNSSPLDTALVLGAIQRDPDQARQATLRDKAKAYLLTHQNADGGWSHAAGGASRTATTAAVVRALAALPNAQSNDALQRSAAFLSGRQNADGGFGDSPSTTHDTANVLWSLAQSGQLGSVRALDAFSFLNVTQQADGSWDGSAYATGLAVRTLGAAQAYNWTVTGVQATPSAVRDGQRVTLTVNISNAGTLPAPASIVRIYDGDPSAGKALVDIPVPPLGVGHFAAVVGSWSTFNASGNHLLVALIDPDSSGSEISRTDNSASVRVAVSAAPPQADLSVTSADVLTSPSVIDRLPTAVGVIAQVSNLGQTDATNVHVRLLLKSSNGVAQVVDDRLVNLLGRSTVPVSLTAVITKPGRQTLSVVVDPDASVNDLDRSNNSASLEVSTVASFDPAVSAGDLVVPSGNVLAGSDTTLKATIHNFGTSDTPPFQAVFAVTDSSVTHELQRLTMQLAAGESRTISVPWLADLSGHVEFVATLDPAATVADADRTNNQARAGFNVEVVNGPNLVVSYREFLANPDPANEGSPLGLSAIVRNTGNAPATGGLYAFFEGDVGTGGEQLTPVMDLPVLQPGESVTVSTTTPALTGTSDRLYFVAVDVPDEDNKEDNQAFRVVTVKALPDLAISTGAIRLTPGAPKPGDHLSIVADVSNLGQQSTGPVTVRLLDGADDSVLGTQVLGGVGAQATASATFSLDLGPQAAARVFKVVVDPEAAIAESNKNNNTAQLAVSVQDGNAFVSEPFFSPDGDGIKDTTTFGFRIPAGAVQVGVVDESGTQVRRFPDAFGTGQASASVMWDGRDNAGRLALDGAYRFQVTSATGQVLAQTRTVLDTNHSLIMAASGTPYEYYRNLSCKLSYYNDFTSTLDEQSLFFAVPSVDGATYQQGVFKVAIQGGEVSTLVGPSFFLSQGGFDLSGVSASARGDQVAFVKSRLQSNSLRIEELWTVGGDGANLRRLASLYGMDGLSPTGDIYINIVKAAVSQDGQSVIAHLINGSGRSVIRKIPVLASDTEDALLFDGSQGELAQISELYMSPNRQRAVLYASNASGDQEYALINLETGQLSRFPMSLYGRRSQLYYRGVKWSPDSQRFVMYGSLNDLGIDNDNYGDFRLDAFDLDFQPVRQLQTSAPPISGNSHWYEGSVSDVEWASNSAEFMFTHEVSTGCYECAGVQKRTGYRVDLTAGTLNTLAGNWWSRRDSEYYFNDSPFLWAPSDRLIVTGGGYDTENRSIAIDTGVAIDAFRGWYATIPQSSGWANMTLRNFSPSGRRLFFDSSRDSSNQASACYANGNSQLFSYESLHNLVADLQPLRDPRLGGILLKGTATDLNFASYALDYANQKTPNDWHTVAPNGAQPKMGELLATWAPPSYGTFFVRLRVSDKAGNTAQVVRRVSWTDTPAITDLIKNLDYISPNGDGVQDVLQLSYRVLEPVHLAFEIVDADGVRRRLIERDHAAGGANFQFEWDGRDALGHVVPDGKYTLKVLDYEFAFEVDNTAPVLDQQYPSHAFQLVEPEQADPNRQLILSSTASVMAATANDRLLDRVSAEVGVGLAPGDWTAGAESNSFELNAQDIPTGTVAQIVDLPDFSQTRVRATARDKAGNSTSRVTALGQEDLFMSGMKGFLWKGPTPDSLESAYKLEASEVRGSYAEAVLNATLGSKDKDVQSFDELVKLVGPLRAVELKYGDSLREQPIRTEFQYTFLPANAQTKAMPTPPSVDDLTHLVWTKEVLLGAADNEHLTSVSALDTKAHEVKFTWTFPSQDKGMWLWRMVSYTADGRQLRSSAHHVSFDIPVDVFSPAEWKSFHDPAPECNATPSERATVSVLFKDSEAMAAGMVVDELAVYWLKADGTTQELARQVLPIPQRVGSRLTRDFFPWDASFSTATWPVGRQDLIVKARVSGTWKQFASPYLYVDHAAPAVKMTAPLDGQKICASHMNDHEGKQAAYLPVAIGIDTRSPAYPDVQLMTATQQAWRTQEPLGQGASYLGMSATDAAILPDCLFEDGNHCRVSGPIQWSNIADLPRENRPGLVIQPLSARVLTGALGQPSNFNGTASLRLRAYGPSGHLACTAPVTVEVDGRVDGSVGVDRTLFSPNADGVLDEVSLSVNAEEPLTVTIEVVAVVGEDRNGQPILSSGAPMAVLARDAYIADGSLLYTWDGKGTGGAVAADGRYALRVKFVDGCQNEKTAITLVELDNTPPAISITSPRNGDGVGLELLVKGSVSDAHLQRYDVGFTTPASPDALVRIPLLGQSGRNVINADLARWVTTGLQGDATLVVTATDLAGNTRTVSVPVTVPPVADVITSLSISVDPFSPNGDGHRDTTSVLYSLSQSAKVSLDLLRAGDGSKIKTLLAGTVIPAGSNAVVWDGKNAQGLFEADGDVAVVLVAETEGGTLVARQEERANFTLDKTPPVVLIESPTTPVFTGAQGASATVTDPLLADATLSISVASGPWTALATLNDGGNRLSASLDDIPEGPIDIRVTASDRAENASPAKVVHAELDRTPPKVALTTPAANAYVSGLKGPYAVQGSIDERNLSRYQLLLAQGAPPAGQGSPLFTATKLPTVPKLLDWNVATLADGAYVMTLRADDLAGQTASLDVPLTVDNTPPVALIAQTDAPMYVKLGTAISGTASDTNFSGYRIDIAPGVSAVANRWTQLLQGTQSVAGSVLFKPTVLPVDGPYTVRLTVADLAGNETVALQDVVIDTTAPAAPLTLTAELKNRRDAQVNWSISSEADLAGYALYRNGARVNAALLTTNTYLDAALPAGTYSYVVKAVDRAGNESEGSRDAQVTVTLSEPVAQLFAPVRDGYAAGVVDVRGTAAAPADFKEYRLYVGQGRTPSTWQLLRRSPVPMTADTLASWNTLSLAEGAVYTLKLEAEDLSGKIVTDTVSATVHNVPPRAPLNLSAHASSADVALTWTANTEPEVVGYLLYRDQQLATTKGLVIGSLLPYAIKPSAYDDVAVPDGKHRYFVQAMDQAGNVSDPSNEVEVSIDTRPPHVEIVKPASGTKVDQVATLVGQSPDTDIASVRFQYQAPNTSTWVDIAQPLTAAPWTQVWSFASLPYGTYQVRAVAIDLGGKTDPAPTPVALVLTDLQPPQPATELKTKVSGGDVRLDWAASTTSSLAGYVIDRTSEFDTMPQRLTPTPVTETSYTDAALADAHYTYIVSAVSPTLVESKPSAPASADVYTPVVVQPYTPTASANSAIVGTARALSHVSVQTSAGVPLSQADANGQAEFALPNVNLSLGDNRWLVYATDDLGNTSKAASLHVVRGTPPAVPSGLQAQVANHDVTLSWTANAESDLLGYLPSLAGKFTSASASVSAAQSTASSTYKPYWAVDAYIPSRAFDSQLSTPWSPDMQQPIVGQWLQAKFNGTYLLDSVAVNFDTPNTSATDFRIEGHDGEVWVPLATVRGNHATRVDLKLSQPYRTDRARLVVLASDSGYLYVSELSFKRLQTTTSLSNTFGTLPDGHANVGVAAVSQLGLLSDQATADAPVGDVVGPATSVLAATVNGADVALSWTASGSADVANYIVQRDGVTIATVATSLPRAYVDHLRPNGHYVYTVFARDAAGNAGLVSNNAPADVQVAGPTASITAQASAPANGRSIDLSWTLGAGAQPSTFTLQRATQAGGPYSVLAQGLTTTGYADTSAQAGTRYYYVVVGLDAAGNVGTASAEVFATAQDMLAPSAPVLTFPGLAPGPVLTKQLSTDIAGLAEPGANVVVTVGGETVARVQATPVDAITSIATSYGDVSSISANGDLIFAARASPKVRHADGTSVPSEGLPSEILSFQFNPDGKSAVVAAYDSPSGRYRLFRWDVATDTSTVWSQAGAYGPLAMSPDGQTVAMIGFNEQNVGGLWLIDAHTADMRRVGTSNQYDFNGQLNWSPDSRRLSYVVNDALNVATLSTGQSQVLDLSTGGSVGFMSWLPDSSALLVDTYQDVDQASIVRVSLDGSPATVVVQGLYAGASVAPDGLSYLVYRGDALVRRDWHGQESVVLPGLNNYFVQPVIWSQKGQFIFQGANNALSLVKLAGAFEFKGAALQPGINKFSAYAFDAAGNGGPSAADLQVRLLTDDMPDWSISQSDWLVLPATPQVGEAADIAVLVRNVGAAGAAVPAVLAVTNEAGQVTNLSMSSLPAMGRDASQNLHARWTPTSAGHYTLSAVVDPARTLLDANRDNNRSVLAFDVSNGQQAELRLTTDASHYPADATAKATVRVLNAGGDFTGELEVRIEDASGFTVLSLGTSSLSKLAFGQTATREVTWAIGQTPAGLYQVTAILRSASGQLVATTRSPVVIDAAAALSATVTTDRLQYQQGDAVRALATVHYASGNAPMAATPAQLQILGSDGSVVAQRAIDLGGMASGSDVQIDLAWVSTVSGTYGVRLTVGPAAAPTLQPSASFQVTTTASPVLNGKLQLASDTVATDEPISAGLNLSNGGATLMNVPVRVRAVDTASGNGLLAWTGTLDAVSGALPVSAQASLVGATWPLGVLDVRLEAQVGGQWLVLDRARVQVTDQTPPLVGFITPMRDSIVRSDVGRLVVSATAHLAPIASVQLSLDGGATWRVVSPQDLRAGLYSAAALPASDGPVTFLARAQDGLGNASNLATLSLVIDNTAPAIAITGVVDQQVSLTDLTPVVNVTDAHLSSANVQLDGVPFTSGSVVGEGVHVLTVTATDKAGNTASTSVHFTIDHTPPVVTLIAPTNGAVVKQIPTVQVQAVDAATGVATVQLRTPDNSWVNMAAGVGGVYSATLPNVADGSHVLGVRATDVVGNVSAVLTFTVNVDNTAPVIAITGVTDQQISRTDLIPMIQVTDANPASTTSLLDGVPFTSGSTVGEGVHLLSVTATDKAGNSASASVRFTIDRTPPLVTLIAPVDGVVSRQMPQVLVKASDALTGVATVQLRALDNSWVTMTADANGVYSATLPNAADGSYVLAVRSTDVAGNVSAVVTFTVNVDNAAPVIAITGVTDQQVSRTDLTPVITVTDANLASASIQLDGVPFTSGTVVGEGVHLLNVTASDKAGNNASASVRFTVDHTPPAVTLLTPATGTVVKQMPQVQVKAIDALTGVATVQLRAPDNSWVSMAAGAAGVYSATLPNAADGTYLLGARATDVAGNISASLDFSVVIDATAPVINIGGVSAGAVYRAAVTPVVTVTDANPDSLVLTLDGSAYVSGQAVSATGSHALVATAVDKAGNTSSRTVAFQIAPLALTGTVSATPASIAVGGTVAIDARLANGTQTAVNAVQVTVTLRNHSTNAVVQTYTDTTDLAAGANYQHAWTWTAAGAVGTLIDVSWTALAEGQTVTLATSQIQIAAPTVAVSLTPALGSWKNVLVFMRCVRSEDEIWGACGNSGQTFSNSTSMATCDSDRKTWLDQYLTAQGVRHTIVTDEASFVRNLRSGLFSGYWISGGGLKLGPVGTGEVMAAVRRGDTLLVEGWGDGHNRLLESITGVSYQGKLGSTSTVTTSSTLFPAATLAVTSPVRMTEVTGHDEASLGTNSGIVSGTYGQGRTMAFAFDLVSTLRTGVATATWNSIVQGSLQFLTRTDPVDVVANGVIDLRANIANQGSTALTLDYIAKIPSASQLLQSSPTVTASTVEGGLPTLRWRLSAAPATPISVEAALRAPLTEGNYVLSTVVNQIGTGGTSTLLQSQQTSLHVSSAATLNSAAIVKVQALGSGCLSSAAKISALGWLNLANMAVAAQQWHDALRYMVAAQYALMWAQGTGTDEAKLSVSQAIEAVERRL